MLGVIGRSGRLLGEFSGAHALACPTEHLIYVAETSNWRVQKIILHGPRDQIKQAGWPARRNGMKIACAALVLSATAFPALAQTVKVTPIGSHPGELCAFDRAMIFEDHAACAFSTTRGKP